MNPSQIPVIETDLGPCQNLKAYESIPQVGSMMSRYTGKKRPYKCDRCHKWHLGWTDADERQALHARIEHAMSYGKR